MSKLIKTKGFTFFAELVALCQNVLTSNNHIIMSRMWIIYLNSKLVQKCICC